MKGTSVKVVFHYKLECTTIFTIERNMLDTLFLDSTCIPLSYQELRHAFLTSVLK